MLKYTNDNGAATHLPATPRAGRARLRYVEREDPGDGRPCNRGTASIMPLPDFSLRSLALPYHAYALPASPVARTAIRVARGTISLISSSRFAAIVGSAASTTPVMLPPGRAKLATNPSSIGSL